jgi:DNA-binding FrmR family transcriptional regulator
LVASIRGAITGLTAELIEDHIREHVVAASDARARSGGAEELIEVIRTYLK